MNIATIYLKYQEEYQNKYGENTVVLMQIGNFYEIYSYDPEKDLSPPPWPDRKLGKADEVAPILNMVLTRRDKNKPYSITTCNMVGFPLVAFDKHRDLLLSHDYTLIRIDQKKNEKGEVERFVSEILSPATTLSSDLLIFSVSGGTGSPNSVIGTYINNNVVSIYIEVLKENVKKENYILAIGLSYIDVTTGDNGIYEIYSKERNALSAIQETYRYLSNMRPKECILFLIYDSTSKFASSSKRVKSPIGITYEEYEDFIYQSLELDKIPIHSIHDEMDSDFQKLEYCNKLLTRIFSSPSPSISPSSSVSNPRLKIKKEEEGNEKEVKRSEVNVMVGSRNMIEELGLERMQYGLYSYINLLQYCNEHNENLIERLCKPKINYLDEDRYLILTHNAASQIDLQPPRPVSKKSTNRNKKKINCLFDVINYTKTLLGKRYLFNALNNPITDCNILKASYDNIQTLIDNQNLLNTITDFLKEIPDVEKLQRRLLLKVIKPIEFSLLFKAYISIVHLCTTLLSSSTTPLSSLLSSVDIPAFNSCLNYVLSRYVLENLSNYTIDNDKLILTSSFVISNTIGNSNEDDSDEENEDKGEKGEKEKEKEKENKTSMFYKGVDAKNDMLLQSINKNKEQLENIIEEINEVLEKTRGKKLQYDNKKKKSSATEGGIGLWTTPHKASVIKKSDIYSKLGLHIINVGKEVMVTSDRIAQLCQNISQCEEDLSKHLYSTYIQTLNVIGRDYSFFHSINQFISQLDFLCSGAQCAIANKYYKPILSENNSSNSPSFLEMRDLRHPIVELLIGGEYVANDIILGTLNNQAIEEKGKKGILLYGLNSVGKSTLLKAVALNVILAQIGYFTACKLRYSPYGKIITRLSGNDDLLNGDSSFIVEMKELRTILRNADEKSLVIADEICRGTESISGTGLSVAAILTLIERGSTFLFSSHLHHIVEMKEIIQVEDKLKICHLAMHFDEEKKIAIYDRKLKDGPGDTVYGIEICKTLDLDPDFIKRAYEIRNSLILPSSNFSSGGKNIHNGVKMKKSKYNSKVYIDSCVICGKEGVGIETHHIKEQKCADANGFIKDTHKNIPGNLVGICQSCHDKLHANGLSLQAIETSHGILLNSS